MSKILKLNSYSQYDELYEEDYMVYEIEYDDGHKEYVSRDVFRRLKALEIVKEICVIKFDDELRAALIRTPDGLFTDVRHYDLLKDVLL